MQSKTIAKEFEKGLPSALYCFWSEEGCFLDDVLTRVIDTVLASSPRDFNYDVFHASAQPQEILDAAYTLPFMSPRRLVVLKDFHQLSAGTVKALSSYMKEPSASTCMVVLSQKSPKGGKDFSWKVFSLDISQREVPSWLRQVAAGKNLRLTDGAVECLIDSVGYEPGLLMMEVEKLALAGHKTVTEELVLSSTSMVRSFTPFELLDALISGQKTRAFRILDTMLAGSALEAPVILGTLNWHYRQFYGLWQNRGKRPAKMREKTYRALLKHLPSYGENDFLGIFESLHEADVGIKSTGRPELELEVLLLKLLQRNAWS